MTTAAPASDAAASTLVERFASPPKRFGPLPIWWWSGDRVTRERLRWQMEQMIRGGIHQAVVMGLAPAGPEWGSVGDDPPFMTDEWWGLIDGACADAAELGFMIWLYDQIGFSGANIQGRLVAADPSFAGTALRRTRRPVGPGERIVLAPPGDDEALMAYVVGDDDPRPLRVPLAADGVEYTGVAGYVTLVHTGSSGFDYLSTDACAALLDSVHGEYDRRLGGWFGTTIGGFFQDELQAMPSWSADFAETFAERFGYDLVPMLWALWEDAGDDAARIRRDYEDHRATRARSAWFDPQAAWMRRHGFECGFDQASPARDGDPVGSVALYGDYLWTHSTYGAPGSDHWGDPKVHSSLAHAYGHERTWIEAFHSSGWGGTLEETYDWLSAFLRRGATLYDPHAVYYSTGGGWWEWAAPSTCWRQPYWRSYDVFATAVARLCSTLTLGAHVCDTVLLSPTTTAQAYGTLDGALPEASAARDAYFALNGCHAWAHEQPGTLERAGADYDVLDEHVVGDAAVEDGRLVVGRERYRNVVVPDAAALALASATVLLALAASGGQVIFVGRPPRLLLGEGAPADGILGGLNAAIEEGTMTVVATPDDVAAHLVQDRATITADVPLLHRRVGDVDVVLLTAHDDRTGTVEPIFPVGDCVHTGLSTRRFWEELGTRGYEYRPTGRRVAKLLVSNAAPFEAQLWDPRTGSRSALVVSRDRAGRASIDVPLPGPMAVVVLGADLPPATRGALGPEIERRVLDGPWFGQATSTLDNTYGDLAERRIAGALPLRVWRLEHAVGEAPGEDEWAPVLAGYGPFAEVCGPWVGNEDDAPFAGSAWQPATWSLSRGIANDPYHFDTLGPKAFVPEAFLDWREVPAGGWVAVRTTLAATRPDVQLVVTANAERIVLVDGVRVPVDGAGYLSTSPWPTAADDRPIPIEIRFRADTSGPIRASFALVTRVDTYRRPEWLTPPSPGVVGRVWEFHFPFELTSLPADTTVHVGSDGPAGVVSNGTTIGRQGDFQPYPGHREVRIHAYDLGPTLRIGANELVIAVTDTAVSPTVALVDSLPTADGGLGVTSGRAGRTAFEDGSPRPLELRRHDQRDRGWLCAWPRAHPLPGAGWLDAHANTADVVDPVIPDVGPGPPRREHLRLRAPLGTVELTVPTTVRCTLSVRGTEIELVDGHARFAEPLDAGTEILLTFIASDGRRAGALLDGPIDVRTEAARVTLVDWDQLGLRSLGGAVTYRTTVDFDGEPGHRVSIDLGDVRGTADVHVNGSLVDRLVWSPWTTEITNHVRRGTNEIAIVVRNTLAGYLDDASPTPAVAAGQARAGLYGPVSLVTHAVHAASGETP